jgi:hypothetical protein
MGLFGSKKPDGIVEAVRYDAKGMVELVRIYERRGPTYSDRVLLSRAELIERLKDGKNFVQGERIKFHAGTFTTGSKVLLSEGGGRELLKTEGAQGQDDDLSGVPIL